MVVDGVRGRVLQQGRTGINTCVGQVRQCMHKAQWVRGLHAQRGVGGAHLPRMLAKRARPKIMMIMLTQISSIDAGVMSP